MGGEERAISIRDEDGAGFAETNGRVFERRQARSEIGLHPFERLRMEPDPSLDLLGTLCSSKRRAGSPTFSGILAITSDTLTS